MQLIARGVIAALLFSALLATRTGAATTGAVGFIRPSSVVDAGQPVALAPGETTLSDGLTVQVRRYSASPVVAVEAWMGVPSDGYGTSRPGIARLAALAVAYESFGGKSLRDVARDAGGQLVVTVYPAATAIALVVPSYAASETVRAILERVYHPAIDQAAFAEARRRLAAQQAAYQGAADVVLRDAVFSSLFSSGSYHVSPYGTSEALGSTTIDDVRGFLRKAYAPGNSIFVVAGDVDAPSMARLVAAKAPLPAAAVPVPPSALDPSPRMIVLANAQAQESGVALAWAGPPISDERSATALDFLADYLFRPDYGVVAKDVTAKYPNLTVSGEFVTLRDPGALYVTVTGHTVDAPGTLSLVRSTIKRATASPMSQAEFTRALDIYRAHALRDNVATAEIIADNFGWYFVHGAPGYAPSATDAQGAGDYYSQIDSLTPQVVFQAVQRYLSTGPATAVLVSHQPSAAQSPLDHGRPLPTPTRGGTR